MFRSLCTRQSSVESFDLSSRQRLPTSVLSSNIAPRQRGSGRNHHLHASAEGHFVLCNSARDARIKVSQLLAQIGGATPSLLAAAPVAKPAAVAGSPGSSAPLPADLCELYGLFNTLALYITHHV